MAGFESALALILAHEGGLVDHPNDPGGITKFGISLRFLRSIQPEATAETIKNLTVEEAAALYKKHFWNASQCGRLPPGIAFAVFDCAVNQGCGTAARMLQESLEVKADGVIGEQTLAAAESFGDDALLDEFMARRAVRYAKTRNFDVFGLGWMRRLVAVHRAGIKAS